MTRKLRDYHDTLIERLREDPLYAEVYLNAALAEGDLQLFLACLKNVVEARVGGMTELADRANLNRESLYRTLSLKGNPRLTSLHQILEAMGCHLAVHFDDEIAI